MDRALKERVVPTFRQLQFKGSYPHFYRDIAGHVDLLTFQFSMSGGRFVVEIAYATPSRGNLPAFLRDTPTPKLRSSFTSHRLRLGATGSGDFWFVFADPMSALAETVSSPLDICDRICWLTSTQGTDWWSQARAAVADPGAVV
jgi:hypothetical protein